MGFPPGIAAKTVTIGTAAFFDGTIAEGTVTVTAPVNVLHTPSNRPIFSSLMSKRFVNGEATFDLVPTDHPDLNRVDWTYKLSVVIQGALKQPDPVNFLLPVAGPDTVDLDGLVTVPSSAGTPVSVPVVTSVNGQTGDVVLSGDGGTIADATVTTKGVVELATTEETTAGTDAARAVTPAGLKAVTDALPTGGGGAVDSVNGETGAVVLSAADVGAQPAGNYATLTDGTVPDNQIPASIARDTEVTAAADAAKARANHTGTQPASTITGLAAVATSGSYGDLTGRPVIPDSPDDIGAQPAGAYIVTVGTSAAPITNPTVARPAAETVYFKMAAGVTPANAVAGDLIWNASA